MGVGPGKGVLYIMIRIEYVWFDGCKREQLGRYFRGYLWVLLAQDQKEWNLIMESCSRRGYPRMLLVEHQNWGSLDSVKLGELCTSPMGGLCY